MTLPVGPRSPFVFVMAQHASASLLKAELGRVHPELTLAYSRPGLYTFKCTAGALTAAFELRSVFARHHGLSLGKAEEPGAVGALVEGVSHGALRLHVFEREASPREGRATPATSGSVLEVRRAILDANPGRFQVEERPEFGERVINVVLPPATAPAEPWLVGLHLHGPERSPCPGGTPRLEPPERAPSRSWSKLEELLRWADIELVAGEQAVEIGAAPGGAAVALLDRGLDVVAIDPAAMDARVAAVAERAGRTFRHLAMPAGGVPPRDLPRRVDWLLCDANLAPQVALRYVERFVPGLRSSLRGVIVTLKLNDARVIAELPALLARMGGLGVGPVRATQLPSHRREVVALACRSVRSQRARSPRQRR